MALTSSGAPKGAPPSSITCGESPLSKSEDTKAKKRRKEGSPSLAQQVTNDLEKMKELAIEDSAKYKTIVRESKEKGDIIPPGRPSDANLIAYYKKNRDKARQKK